MPGCQEGEDGLLPDQTHNLTVVGQHDQLKAGGFLHIQERHAVALDKDDKMRLGRLLAIGAHQLDDVVSSTNRAMGQGGCINADTHGRSGVSWGADLEGCLAAVGSDCACITSYGADVVDARANAAGVPPVDYIRR